MNQLQSKYHISNHFILFVGTLQPRKNIVRLIEAFSKLKTGDKPENLELIIIGKKGWQYEEIFGCHLKKFGVKNGLNFLEDIQDEELNVFYQHAIVMYYRVCMKWFGLPVVEAMQRGCPVITSNVSSLPEAGGDAALYVDPENVDDIAENNDNVDRGQKVTTRN